MKTTKRVLAGIFLAAMVALVAAPAASAATAIEYAANATPIEYGL